jgi:flagellar assembly protein FliH
MTSSSDERRRGFERRVADRDAEMGFDSGGLFQERRSGVDRRPSLPVGAPFPNVPPAAGRPASNPYARFIPREELGEVARWAPSRFGGEPESAPVPAAAAPAPEEPPAPPPPTPEEVAARRKALAEQHLKAAREAGYQDGYRDGKAALESFRISHAQQSGAQLAAVIGSLQARFEQLEQGLAQQVAAIATELARQVVRDELRQHPGLVIAVAQEALGALLVSARHVSLRLNPEDMALVAHGAADVLAARGARLVPDAAVERGGCVVESDIGVVDAQVATRWERAAGLLGASAPWQGVAAAPVAGVPPVASDAVPAVAAAVVATATATGEPGGDAAFAGDDVPTPFDGDLP